MSSNSYFENKLIFQLGSNGGCNKTWNLQSKDLRT